MKLLAVSRKIERMETRMWLLEEMLHSIDGQVAPSVGATWAGGGLQGAKEDTRQEEGEGVGENVAGKEGERGKKTLVSATTTGAEMNNKWMGNGDHEYPSKNDGRDSKAGMKVLSDGSADSRSRGRDSSEDERQKQVGRQSAYTSSSLLQPELDKFRRMLRVGVPEAAVRLQMSSKGLDPSLL